MCLTREQTYLPEGVHMVGVEEGVLHRKMPSPSEKGRL